MAQLSLSQADQIGGMATVNVWQVPADFLFPPGINLIIITDSKSYFLLDRTPLTATDWIVVGQDSVHTKLNNKDFLLSYSVKVPVAVELSAAKSATE